MAFSAIDLVNIESEIKSLKNQFQDMISSFHEIIVTIDCLEYFLSHYKDVAIEDSLVDDLPL